MLLASALTWAAIVLTAGFPLSAPGLRNTALRDFVALLAILDDQFIGDYDEDAVTTASLRAAVDALDDIWSFYMTPEEFARHLDSSHNRYEGIGVTVAHDEDSGYMRVVQVVRGSSAETAGIVAGDVIMTVDGESVRGLSFAELRGLLLRPIGDSAELTVQRNDGGVELLAVVYSVIFVDPISYSMLDDYIGFIRINNFNEGSGQSFVNAASGLIDLGARALVFDVRGNPGGWVSEMTRMLDFLLPEGEIFVSVDGSGIESVIYSDAYYVDLPMVVLVDRFSFSGAEYFAAILGEYGFAEVVGEQTTGKSRMQRVFGLPGGGAVNISFAEYLTKNRVSLHDEGGLTPDYIVVFSDEELFLFHSENLSFEQDSQLQKALYLLR